MKKGGSFFFFFCSSQKKSFTFVVVVVLDQNIILIILKGILGGFSLNQPKIVESVKFRQCIIIKNKHENISSLSCYIPYVYVYLK